MWVPAGPFFRIPYRLKISIFRPLKKFLKNQNTERKKYGDALKVYFTVPHANLM